MFLFENQLLKLSQKLPHLRDSNVLSVGNFSPIAQTGTIEDSRRDMLQVNHLKPKNFASFIQKG